MMNAISPLRNRVKIAVALLIAATALPACGGEEDFGEIDEISSAVHQVCGGSNTVKGIDISAWQETVNWDAVKNDGVYFAFARVSDGMKYPDKYFNHNWSEIRRVGLIRGVYQYFRPSQDALAQANYLITQVKNGGGLDAADLPPVLDLEAAEGMSASAILAKVNIWLEAVKKAFNRTPIIYTGSYFWDDNIGSKDYAGYPLWIPNYTTSACPLMPNAWNKWLIWQYTDSGQVAGVSGGVDTNRFNGTLAELKSYIASSVIGPQAPQLTLRLDVSSIGNQGRDFCQEGASKDIFDIYAEQETSAYAYVKNTGTQVARNTTIALEVLEPYLQVTSWHIESDWQNNGQFKINDTDDLQQISHDNPGATFRLNVGGLSPGETKRVSLTLRAGQFSGALNEQHATLKTYLVHVDNFYEKGSFDAAPNNVGDYQKQNGGDIKFNYQMDVLSAEICDGLDNDCNGQIDESCVESSAAIGKAPAGVTEENSVGPADSVLGVDNNVADGGCQMGGASSAATRNWLSLMILLVGVLLLRRRK